MFRVKNDDGRARWLERRHALLAGMVGFDAVGSPALVPLIAQIYAGSQIKAALAGSTVFACRFVRLPRPRCPRVRVRRTRWR